MCRMNYEIYSEESNVIGICDYAVIRNKIEKNQDNKVSRQGRQRKIYFNRDINYLVDVSGQEDVNTDRYSINIYNGDTRHMTLDKQSNREGTIYRQYTYITTQQCERILQGDIGWMAESDDVLLRELYLQMTINQRVPGVIVDYTREMYRMGFSGDYLIFDTQIRSTYDIEPGQLSPERLVQDVFKMTERLEPGKVVMTYRQGLGMPKVLANIVGWGQNRRQIS